VENYSEAYSQRSSHTHCQAPQVQAKTKVCQRVCLPQPEKNFKIFLPLFKEKIKTLQRTTDQDNKDRNESIDKFNMKVQFDRNLRTDKNRQCIINRTLSGLQDPARSLC
jgi:hypothetical protein